MRRLLCDGGGEFPAEYLVSRLRGRRRERLDWRQALATGVGDPAWPSEEAVEEGRDREVRWLYRQMDSPTRKILAPIFVLLELRRFINWLRQLEGRGGGGLTDDSFFTLSLLDNALLQDLKKQGTAGEALWRFEKRAVPLLPALQGIARTYEQKGLLEVEQRMTATILACGATGSRRPLMRDLCRRLIDFGNVLRLVKAWLWKLPALPPFMAAGYLSPARLRRIDAEGDVGRLGLPASVSRATITPEQIAVLEARQREMIWRAARVAARGLEPLAVIIEYLCFIEAEAVLLRGQGP